MSVNTLDISRQGSRPVMQPHPEKMDVAITNRAHRAMTAIKAAKVGRMRSIIIPGEHHAHDS